jgi:hypothetical protein
MKDQPQEPELSRDADVLPMPLPEYPGESPVERTRRLLALRPEVLDRVAYNLWLHQRGAASTQTEAAAWSDLAESRKVELRSAALVACEAHWALPQEWQDEQNRQATALTMERNEALFQQHVNATPELRRLRNDADRVDPVLAVDPSWSPP